MFCCTLIYVHSSIAIILMGKRELIALLNLSSWCLVMVEGLFLAVPGGCLQFVIVVFPDHTHLHFLICNAAVKVLFYDVFVLLFFILRNFQNGEDRNNWIGPPHNGNMSTQSVQVTHLYLDTLQCLQQN